MANSNTGFFRVNKVSAPDMKKGCRYAYQMKNELLKVDIRKGELMDLKNEVENRGLLWGITDLEKAICSANENETDILELEGRYGLKMKKQVENGF